MKKLSMLAAAFLAGVMALAFTPNATAWSLFGGKSKTDQGKTMLIAGEVVSISKSSVEVRTLDGKTFALTVNDKTRFGTEKSPMKLNQFAKGDHVKIDYSGEGKQMMALDISKAASTESHVAAIKTPEKR